MFSQSADGGVGTDVGGMKAEPAKVLIVDDEPDIVEAVIELLEGEGLACLSALNAQSAMEQVYANPDIGVVVTDVRMPGMNGLEMARQLKATIQPERDLFVIVVTGHAGMQEALEAIKLGAEDFLTKPISPEHLVLSVRRAEEMLSLRQHERDFHEQLKTEVRAKTADLNDANAKLTAANQIKDQFLSVMGHELRTPLNAINGFGELLKGKVAAQNDNDAKQYVDHILESASRLSNTIENILEFSDATSGRRKPRLEWQVIDDLLASVLAYFEAPAQQSEITLHVAALPKDQLVMLDAAMVGKALHAVIDNAIKFSPAKSTVTIDVQRDDKAVTFVVEDHGCGMRADDIARAIEPLSQVNSTLSRPSEGTGLGLSLAGLLTDLQGGKLAIESAPGEGTTVRIALPIHQIH